MADEQPSDTVETAVEETTPTTDNKVKPEPEKPPTDQNDQLPPDHPLVKAYEALKASNKELKAKAVRLEEVEEEKRRENQSWQERAEAAEGTLATLQAAQQISDWKQQVSEMKKYEGVPAKALRGTTLEEIEEHAAELKALLPEPRKPGSVPGEGRTVTSGTGDRREQFANIIRGT